MEPIYQLLIFTVLAIPCIIWALKVDKRKKRMLADEIDQAKTEYESALKANDKVKALALGRIYYSLLRRGALTIYDEQAIANDLSTIDNKKNGKI